jgi:hypothetical protein
MKTIHYSDNKQFYYIKEFAGGWSYWLSVTKFPRKPASCGWISDIIKFDNTYYRHALPFTFWEIQDKTKLEEQVADEHELVKDYETVEQFRRNPKKENKREIVQFT